MITPTSERARRSTPEEALAAAVLEQLLHDLRSANKNVRYDAERALSNSQVMQFWADVLGLDHDLPERLREALTRPQPPRKRAHGQQGRRVAGQAEA